ncbi:MAG: glycoside hydrolase family 3 C-terminal domain-containing protein [Ruminococcus sp.]|uniref:glycoside hydrolase family 3 N-terminal domain-containing protein n=1 Tax=Ruminococcus sp. TaxID=41978 RepID=UPI0025D9914B|nr:glycoside hydrolase family 3 N-terminal domain-containing protein [Ruminococcus sp.]MBR5682789.1 glycoside hydrolase family 3 C-terminal domain-containing protein [Ruminococcus sp.]
MELTTDEQIIMVNGQSFFGMGELPHKGVPRIQMLDGGTGLNFEQLFGDLMEKADRPEKGTAVFRKVLDNFYQPGSFETKEELDLYSWLCEQIRAIIPEMTAPGCYPPGMLLGATWDPATVYQVGQALGHEARAYGVHVLLGTPNINLHRDLRAGRLFEGYSEDPYLITKLAPELVRGVQSQGVAANVKHFAANNQETNRQGINEIISERALYELYLPGFEACVKAGCATVMAAYNQINGLPCTENNWLLTELLRGEWGFEGIVMSDWGAVYNPAASVNAGCDVNMPGPVPSGPLRNALADGRLEPEKLAESAERAVVLAQKYALPPAGHIDEEMTDSAAYKAAAEGIVMLKNSPCCNGAEQKCCPLPVSSKIALMGSMDGKLLICGEGSACVRTNRGKGLCAELRRCFADVRTGLYDGADTIVYVLNVAGQEGNDRKTLRVDDEEQKCMSGLCGYARRSNMRSVLILNTSGPVTGSALDMWDAVFWVSLPGMQGAAAITDILCGKVAPSGRLPLTFPCSEDHMPTYLNFPGDGMTVNYGEGIFVGYRYYVTRRHRSSGADYARYCFGHGLSYSTFEVREFRVESGDIANGLELTAYVENTGDVAGKTVVQIYVHDPVSTLTKPVCQLCAFQKVYLEPHQTEKVHLHVDSRSFESWDPDLHAWTLEDGEYVLNATVEDSGAVDWHDRAGIVLRYDGESPYSWGENTSIKEIYENPQLKAALCSFMQSHGLSWEMVLTTYQYTAMDSVGKLLDNTGCSDALKAEFMDILRQMRYLKR